MRRAALECDRRAVECGDCEAFEVVADVFTLVAQDAESHSLAEPQPPFIIGPPMNPREVACLSDL